MPNGTEWTGDIIARFTALHADDGLSFREIALMLSKEFHINLTKNACIGKARRLNLLVRPRVAPPKPRPGQNRKRRALMVPPFTAVPVLPGWQVEPPLLPPSARRVTIYQLRGGVCHFPHGERPPYTYCGATAPRGSSWCPHHQRVIYPRGKI